MFELRRGISEFTSEMTLEFVRFRVYEPNYDLIKEVLAAYELEHYDAWELFKAMKGECAYDDLTIDEDYENAEIITITATPMDES